MLYEVEGDIMLSRAEVLVLGVSANDQLTRGLARKLQERYPAMALAFRQWSEDSQPQPGEIWHWGEAGSRQIVCLLTHQGDTRYRPGRPDKIAVNRSFQALSALTRTQRFKSLAMPPVGAGEFGLDWYDVRGMLHAQLGGLLQPIFVYIAPRDGQVAHEPGM